MSKPVRAGDLRVISLRRARQQCAGVALAAFLAGGVLGLYAGHAAWAEANSPIRASLTEIGKYLCAQWGGIREIWRVDQTHYGFACQTIAVFPRTEVTLKEKP